MFQYTTPTQIYTLSLHDALPISPGKILRAKNRAAVDEFRQAAPEDTLGRSGNVPKNLDGELVRQDGDGFLVDDASRVGLLHHLVQGRAGLGLAVDDRPVDRRAPAVLRKERAVHVECAPCWALADLRAHHPAVVERNNE